MASSGSNFPELIELVKRCFPLNCTEILSSFPSFFSSIWKRYSSSLARTLVTLRRANTAFARNFPSSRSACLRYFWISSFPETRSTHMAHAQLDFSPFLRSWIISSTTTFGIFFPPQTVSRMLWVKSEILRVSPFVFLSLETSALPRNSLSASFPSISTMVREKLIYRAISPISALV